MSDEMPRPVGRPRKIQQPIKRPVQQPLDENTGYEEEQSEDEYSEPEEPIRQPSQQPRRNPIRREPVVEYEDEDLPPPPTYKPNVTNRPNSKVEQVDYRKSSWFSLGGIKQKFNLKFNQEKCYLINMELKNGMHTTFIVKEKESTFAYNGKKYTFDDDLKYLHIDTMLYALDYHEDFVMPIKRKIDINEVNRAISGSGITEIEYMTNPSTLERFTVSKIAEGIMKGQQLDEFFRQIRLIVIIGALIGLLHLILFVAKTGMLKQINIPGLG